MACVDLPAFPLQLLLRLHPDWREAPVAVVERDRPQGLILWVNEAARSARILPGMRYAAGLSLARELRAGVVTEQAIAEGIEQVGRRLRFFTPEVEPAPGQPGVFWLGAEGLGLLHATLAEWGAAIRDDLACAEAGHLRARVAIGFSRFGSYAIAKAGLPAVVVVDDAEEEATLVREIPLARLSLEPGFRDTLLLLGIETLGAFLDLPGPEVQRRFGAEVAAFQRAARGDLWAPLQPEALETPLERRVVFDLPQVQLDLLLPSIEELLHALLADLARRERCLSALHLTLAVDQPGSPIAARTTLRRERLEPAHPTLDARQLMELIRLRLENRVLSAGVMEVRIDAEWQKATVEQLTLFAERPKRDPRALERALAAVRADLGDGSVVRARLREAHLPEARFEWEPFVQIPKATPRRVYLPPLVRRFFTRALPLPLTSRHEPDGWLIRGLEGGAVEERIGPYIIAGGWWRKAVHREYHYVRTARGRWLWVYHDRARRRWFQQGEVG
ncbi:MAG: DNA polymerase Y family protein [Candidatus Eisenbacteria bacterium]